LRQCGKNLFPVFRPFISKDICLDSLADAPVEQSHSRIYRAGDTLAGLLDHGTHVGYETGIALDDAEVVVFHARFLRLATD
jgi:hypothetical protein